MSKKAILSYIFNITNDKNHKIITILGIKLKFRNWKQISKTKTITKNQTKFSKNTLLNYKTFYEQIDKKNFKNNYLQLIKNMDNDSIDIIATVLSRMERIYYSNTSIFNSFYSSKELDIAESIKMFKQNVIKLDDGCYAYKQYLLPIKRFPPEVFYYKYNLDKVKDLNKILNKSIIDVGAYVGDSALLFSDYTNSSVYAFEASTKNFDMMLKTISLNNKTNIIPIKGALGAQKGQIQMYVNSEAVCDGTAHLENSLAGIHQVKYETELVDVHTLDEFVEKNNIKVGLIKVDIEGYEQEFLRGALNTIRNQKPILLISIYHNANDFFNIKPLIESLNLGYTFKVTEPIAGTVRSEILLICE